MKAAIVVVLLYFATSGCATTSNQNQLADNAPETEMEDFIVESYCSPAVSPESIAQEESAAMAAQLKEETSPGMLLLSPTSRQIAKVIRVDNIIGEIPLVERNISNDVPGARLRLLEMRQELSDKLLLALFDASSVAAELECEKGRADALAAGLEEVQNNIQQRRTVIALLSDATAGLLSGVFLFGGSDVLAGGADIIGNVLQGSFGYAALGGQQQYEMRLSRNVLQEIWEGPESSSMFPPSVWRFLNSSPSTDRRVSRRDIIVQEWKKRLATAGAKTSDQRKELYFGQGGIYTGNELRHRAEMLDRLKASVRLMSQDLNLLFKESLGHFSGVARMMNDETTPIAVD
ncbi:MAG TPA: hypothetical protein VHF07_00015 [Nitrospiraceae bacterium]|nr:hypothetical protein [Nitrospiraceae bacterium]